MAISQRLFDDHLPVADRRLEQAEVGLKVGPVQARLAARGLQCTRTLGSLAEHGLANRAFFALDLIVADGAAGRADALVVATVGLQQLVVALLFRGRCHGPLGVVLAGLDSLLFGPGGRSACLPAALKHPDLLLAGCFAQQVLLQLGAIFRVATEGGGVEGLASSGDLRLYILQLLLQGVLAAHAHLRKVASRHKGAIEAVPAEKGPPGVAAGSPERGA